MGIVCLLLAHFCPVDVMDAHARTALLIAVTCGLTGSVRLLLEHKSSAADVDQQQNSGIIIAAAQGHRQMIGPLVVAACDINWTNSEGKTALALAASLGRFRICEELLFNGADVDAGKVDPIEMARAKGGRCGLLTANLLQQRRRAKSVHALLWIRSCGDPNCIVRLLPPDLL